MECKRYFHETKLQYFNIVGLQVNIGTKLTITMGIMQSKENGCSVLIMLGNCFILHII